MKATAVSVLLFYLTFLSTPSAAATVSTDKPDYQPGEVVIITGSGWQPGEDVELRLEEDPDPSPTNHVWTVRADGDGNFTDSSFVVDETHRGVTFTLTATGQSSGLMAQTTFTDGRTITSVTLNGAMSVIVKPSATITAAVTVVTDGSGNAARWRSTSWLIATTTNGTTTCMNHPNHVAGTNTETFTITAPATPGTNNAYFIAYNNNGCSSGASTTFTLTNAVIVDNTAPTITCPANIVTNTASGQCSRAVTFTVTASDAHGVTSTNCTPASGSAFPKGTNTVTCTATDAAGNTNSCTFTVTVNDNEPPVANCPANIATNTAPGQCSRAVTWNATAADNCPGATITCNPANGSTFPKGTTTVVCTATDGSGNTSCTFTVTVSDTEPPVTTCPTNLVLTADAGECSKSNVTYTATATDNCMLTNLICTPASGSTFPVGTTTVTCTATDSSANTNNCSFTVTVNDTERPSITCPTNRVVDADAGQCSKSNVTYAVVATDNCAVTNLTCVPASGSTFPIGTTTVTCTATDSAGNSTNCTFTVTVRDTEDPVITCSTNRVVECSSPSGTPVFFTTTATDNCTNVMIFCSIAPGSLFPPGTTTVQCAAYDATSNTTVCEFTVTVVDTTPPVLTCPSNMVVGCNRSNGAVVLYTVGVMDNCDSNVTLTCTPPSGSLLPQGTNTVMCSAVDQSGNSNSCSFTITVVEGPISLSIARAGPNVIVSWPVTCATYILEQTTNLSPPIIWMQNMSPVVVSNNQNRATVPRAGFPEKYFRLRQQ